MDADDIAACLERDGLIRRGEARFTPLAGGVSSDVWRVDCPDRTFVVKRCVPKLRVAADWYSDPARLRHEFLYLQAVAGIVPGAVPELISSDPEAGFIAMEFLGGEFVNWKALLLGGDARPEDASRAGAILGRIHAATRGDIDTATRFETLDFFTQLRIDAYLRATALRQSPPVAAALEEEAARLTGHRECLVHGDYSPKNMLVSDARFCILDCETACFGDPAFDLAFLLNHLCLKALHHAPADRGLDALVAATRAAYRAADPAHAREVEQRTARLLPMLMLARVDGKSPAEYLTPPRQEAVRLFATEHITTEPEGLSRVLDAWFSMTASHADGHTNR